jgi:hypothetical protein
MTEMVFLAHGRLAVELSDIEGYSEPSLRQRTTEGSGEIAAGIHAVRPDSLNA